jgi:hypothetical protein
MDNQSFIEDDENVIAMRETARELKAMRKTDETIADYMTSIVAAELADAFSMTHGGDVLDFNALPAMMQERYRRHARVAIEFTDPNHVEELIESTARHIADWMNEPFTGQVPTPEDIAREALCHFLGSLYHQERAK